VLVLVDEVLPGMMEPNDVGPLNLSLGHFNCAVIINSDKTMSLEYPDDSLKLHERIRERAYELHQKRGGKDGHDLDDWLTAEAEPSAVPEQNL
jgi:hypothetical protein